jgi:hypothetical protein
MQASVVAPIVVLLAACGSPPAPTPVVQTTAPAASITPTGAKTIVREGEDYILPDGPRIPADQRGGFRLPNGEYVAALADSLLLPKTVCNVRRTMREDMSAPDHLGRADAGASCARRTVGAAVAAASPAISSRCLMSTS